MKPKTITLLLIALVFISGCIVGEAEYICWDEREPDIYVTFTIRDTSQSEGIALDKCQDSLSKVVMQRVN